MSFLVFTLSTVLGYLMLKGDLFAVKGGPNPGPRHRSRGGELQSPLMPSPPQMVRGAPRGANTAANNKYEMRYVEMNR
jgi:hypothetical protein